MSMNNPAPPKFKHVILDRDGVLNREPEGEKGYLLSPDKWIWVSGALDGLAMIADAAVPISIATNQSCIGRGLIDTDKLEEIHAKVRREAAARGVFFAAIHFCPHAPEDDCRCRKPKTGLLEAAIDQSGIPPEKTVFIGDAGRDLQAAQSAGMHSWLVRTGKGMQTEAEMGQGIITDLDPAYVLVFDDLLAACRAMFKGNTP
ncbi:MAG: HAD-IIIA family hydrolase [Desulfobacteraceae bacterium]|nr:HAD-IIIA family hydrolase [Desulfobacteraceae bacterium]